MKVGAAIAEILKREGVEILTGYPVNHLIEFAAAENIRPIMVRQERIGLHMADDLLARGGRLNRALGRHYKRQLVAFPFVEQFMRDNGRAREVDMAT